MSLTARSGHSPLNLFDPHMWPFKKRVETSVAHDILPAEKPLESAASGDPTYCCVEFESNDEKSLRRLTDFFNLVKAAKDSNEPTDEAQLSAFLTNEERSYFSNLTPEQQAEWNEYWFSTPLPMRHSPAMLTPQWDFDSMLDAFWNAEYDLIAIRSQTTRHVLEFNPHAYPYGGTGSLIALVESFGHRVVGVDDGTGYQKYVQRTHYWTPSSEPGA